MTPAEATKAGIWLTFQPVPGKILPDVIFGRSRYAPELPRLVVRGFACLKCGRSSAIGGNVGCSELCQSCQP